MGELCTDNASDDAEPVTNSDARVENTPALTPSDSRRSFLRANIKRAAYVAPMIWSISARQAHAASVGSGFS